MISPDTVAATARAGRVTLDWSLSVGNLLTALTIAVSAATLAYTRRKDRLLREREYADRIRHAAGLTIARLERWQRIVISIFDEIQPAFVDVDRWAVAGKDLELISDYLWKELSKARAQAAQRIMEEEIELSYLDLYSYDRGVHERFNHVIREQQQVRQRVFGELLTRTQRLLLRYRGIPLQRTFIGNQMREEAAGLRQEFADETRAILDRFIEEMRPLVTAKDADLYARELPAPFARERQPLDLRWHASSFTPPLREHFVLPGHGRHSAEPAFTPAAEAVPAIAGPVPV